ncbi:ribonuclease H-like domain-containing protein [Tanacetum coccineum]
MSEPMPTIPTQSPFTYPNPNPSASPSFTQDDTSESFIPEPTQPMPTFTQTAFSQPAVNYQQVQPNQSIFSQPAVHFQQTQPTQTNQTGQQYPNNVQSQQFQQFQTATISANNAKFPYLEKEKYEIWAMKMEYWIQNADHNLWRIVQQGNSPKRLGKDAKGNTIVHPPVSLDEHVAVQRENKVRTLLLQALPEDHMPDFHHYDDARDIWMAVKARFGGNEESKKMRKTMLKQQFTEFSVTEEEGLHKGYDRFQKILSQLNQVQARPDNDDINLKFLRALPSSWSQVALALKTRGGLDSMSFDDLYNKLRSLELDVRIGHSYGVKAAAAPTHSAFIGAASSGSKLTYSDQQSIVPSVYQTSGRSDNIMECVLHSFVAENEPDQDMIYEDFDQVDQLEMEELDLKWQMAMLSLRINRFEKKDRDLGHFARECNVKTVDDKARYSAFKVTEVKTDEPKALVSVDSMVNWSDHAAEEENKTGEVEKVYGMMAGLHSDNGGTDVSDAAAEFAMMGISPKVHNCPLGCDSKINDLNNMYNNLDRLYNDCYIKVQAYQNAVKTLESQKDCTNRKERMEVKLKRTLARFEKWKGLPRTCKNCNSSLFTRTKMVIGFKEYFGKDEVFDLSTPSVFDPEPVEEDKPLYSWFVKAGELSCCPTLYLELLCPPHILSDEFARHQFLTGRSVSDVVETVHTTHNPPQAVQNSAGEPQILLGQMGYSVNDLTQVILVTDNDIGTQALVTTIKNVEETSDSGSFISLKQLCMVLPPAMVLVLWNANAENAEELAKLQRQEYEMLWSPAARICYLFSTCKQRNTMFKLKLNFKTKSSCGHFQPAGCDDPAALGDPAVSTSVSADFIPVHADESTLPPGKSLGSSENTKRFPVPSDTHAVGSESSSYKKGEHFHPQSQILGDLASPVLTRSRAQQIHTKATFEDPDWVDAMQEEMQQFINQQVWKLVPLPAGKHAIGTKWILKNKRDARGIVVRNKASTRAGMQWSEFSVQHYYRRVLWERWTFLLRLQAETVASTGIFYAAKTSMLKDMLTKSDMESLVLVQDIKLLPHEFYSECGQENFSSIYKGQFPKTRVCAARSKLLCYFFYWKREYVAAAAAVHRSSMLLLVVILSAGRLVSAGCTMFLAGSFSFCLTIGFCCFISAGTIGLCGLYYVMMSHYRSAGSYPFLSGGFFVLMVVFIYAERVYVSCLLCMVPWMKFIHAAGVVYAAYTSIYAAGWCVSLILLVGWSMPLVTWILLVVSIPAGVTITKMITTESLTWEGKKVPRTSAISSAMWTTLHRVRFNTMSLLSCLIIGQTNLGQSAVVRPYAAGARRKYLYTTFASPLLLLAMLLWRTNAAAHELLETLGTSVLTFSHSGFLPMSLHLHLTRPLRPLSLRRPLVLDLNLDSWVYWSLRDLELPMEDDTTHDGFHVASPGGPNDAPTPTADAAGRAEDPTLLTSLSAKLDRCLGRIDSLETELGTSKKIMGGAILTLVSRVKKLERTVKQIITIMASEALGHDQPAVPSEDIEEREEEEVPLRRKRSAHRRARTEFHTSAFAQFHAPLSTDVLPQADISESAGPSVGADKGKAPMPDLEIPAEFLAEDAQARQRLEEEQD